jgi:tRNA(fMet)-specific endonuclease VapC
VPFDDESAAIAGRLRKELEREGRTIGPHDTQIAAIALQHDWTLVASNTDEFSRVVGLKIEDWAV